MNTSDILVVFQNIFSVYSAIDKPSLFCIKHEKQSYISKICFIQIQKPGSFSTALELCFKLRTKFFQAVDMRCGERSLTCSFELLSHAQILDS